MPTTRVDVSVAQPRDRPEREGGRGDRHIAYGGRQLQVCKLDNLSVRCAGAVLVLDIVVGVV